MNTPTLVQLQRGLEIAEKISKLQAEMASILQGNNSTPAPLKRKKGKISTEGLARIIAAQKKRWAKVKAGKKAQPQKAQAQVNKKGGITAAGRAKLAASMKARWAAKMASIAPAATQDQAAPNDLAPAVRPSVEETQISTPVVEESAAV